MIDENLMEEINEAAAHGKETLAPDASPKDFAKIVRSTDGHQVLLTREDEEKEGIDVYSISVETDMIFFSGKITTDYGSESYRDKVFDEADTAFADQFRSGLSKFVGNISNDDNDEELENDH